MKVYSAKYDPAYNTSDNSLVNNMLKYPEIASKIIELYPRYSMTYLLERLGFGASEKVIGGNSFEWKVMNRYKAAAKLDGTQSTSLTSTKTAGDVFTLNIASDSDAGEFCMLAVNDVVRFSTGGNALVTSVGTINSGSAGYTEVTFKQIDTNSEDISAQSVVAVIGSAYGQGSLGDEVGEGYAYPETHRNHLTLSRRKCKINGLDLHDVTWVEHNGHRLWYFTKEQQMTDQFMYELELNRWFGKSSMPTSDITYPGQTGESEFGLGSNSMPIMGDGILAQIATANQLSTAGIGITEGELLKFIGHLSLNSLKASGNEYVVFTGMQGMIQFQQAMGAYLATMGAASPLIASKSGAEVSVGANFTSYEALGNRIKLVHNPCFDDPNVAAMTAGISSSGFNTAQLSGLMVFMDMSVQDGVGNVELIAKGAEGYNRNYVKKYVPGMINPNDPSSMLAANGNDTFECHILSESGVIVRNPQSCGVIKPAGLTI